MSEECEQPTSAMDWNDPSRDIQPSASDHQQTVASVTMSMQRFLRPIAAVLPALLAVLLPAVPAHAQAAGSGERALPAAWRAPFAVSAAYTSPAALAPDDERAGMPAWLKWGLVGGAATGTVAVLLNGMNTDTGGPGTAEAAARGFAIGFVTVGGGVALYGAICKPGGWSRRNGLCDRNGRRR